MTKKEDYQKNEYFVNNRQMYVQKLCRMKFKDFDLMFIGRGAPVGMSLEKRQKIMGEMGAYNTKLHCMELQEFIKYYEEVQKEANSNKGCKKQIQDHAKELSQDNKLNESWDETICDLIKFAKEKHGEHYERESMCNLYSKKLHKSLIENMNNN